MTRQKPVPVTPGTGASHITVTHMFGNHLMTQTLPRPHQNERRAPHVRSPSTPSRHFAPKPNATMTHHPPHTATPKHTPVSTVKRQGWRSFRQPYPPLFHLHPQRSNTCQRLSTSTTSTPRTPLPSSQCGSPQPCPHLPNKSNLPQCR